MWGRFSGSTESFIDQDLAALEGPDGGLNKLLDQLRLWHGGLRIEPGRFTGWSLGARFCPVLYLLTRMGQALAGQLFSVSWRACISRSDRDHPHPTCPVDLRDGYAHTELDVPGY